MAHVTFAILDPRTRLSKSAVRHNSASSSAVVPLPAVQNMFPINFASHAINFYSRKLARRATELN